MVSVPELERDRIHFFDLHQPLSMGVGHKKAYAKGGSTTLKNSVALCHRCNKLQGTDSWDVFLGKQGITVAVNGSKGVLSKLSLPELKYLASKHGLKLKATLVRGDFLSSDYHKPPSKKAYVRELAKVVSEKDAKSDLRALLNSRLR